MFQTSSRTLLAASAFAFFGVLSEDCDWKELHQHDFFRFWALVCLPFAEGEKLGKNSRRVEDDLP